MLPKVGGSAILGEGTHNIVTPGKEGWLQLRALGSALGHNFCNTRIRLTKSAKWSSCRFQNAWASSHRDTVDGINLATLARLLEDVQGYEAAIPFRTHCKALLRPQCLQCCLIISVSSTSLQSQPAIRWLWAVPVWWRWHLSRLWGSVALLNEVRRNIQ